MIKRSTTSRRAQATAIAAGAAPLLFWSCACCGTVAVSSVGCACCGAVAASSVGCDCCGVAAASSVGCGGCGEGISVDCANEPARGPWGGAGRRLLLIAVNRLLRQCLKLQGPLDRVNILLIHLLQEL